MAHVWVPCCCLCGLCGVLVFVSCVLRIVGGKMRLGLLSAPLMALGAALVHILNSSSVMMCVRAWFWICTRVVMLYLYSLLRVFGVFFLFAWEINVLGV